jgi:hypothetical protein
MQRKLNVSELFWEDKLSQVVRSLAVMVHVTVGHAIPFGREEEARRLRARTPQRRSLIFGKFLQGDRSPPG